MQTIKQMYNYISKSIKRSTTVAAKKRVAEKRLFDDNLSESEYQVVRLCTASLIMLDHNITGVKPTDADKSTLKHAALQAKMAFCPNNSTSPACQELHAVFDEVSGITTDHESLIDAQMSSALSVVTCIDLAGEFDTGALREPISHRDAEVLITAVANLQLLKLPSDQVDLNIQQRASELYEASRLSYKVNCIGVDHDLCSVLRQELKLSQFYRDDIA